MEKIIPNRLQKGDKVMVIAPARGVKIIGKEVREIAKQRLESLGLEVVFAPNAIDENWDYMGSSSIEKRVSDIHTAFTDKSVKGIMTIIGGANSNQLLKYLDYDLIRQNPKVFCGFSDITALENAILAKTGMITYYGPHFSSLGMKKGCDYTFEHFIKMLVEEGKDDIAPSQIWSDDLWFIDQENREFIPNDGMFVINEGKAEGEIVGGNLCTLNLLQGTKYMPNIENKILFLEDDNMAGKIFLMEFDRNLQSLIHTPEFKTVKALVLGRAEKDCIMTKEKWIKMIKNKPELQNIPVIAGVDFGHTTPIIAFPIGGKARLEAKDNNIKLFIKG